MEGESMNIAEKKLEENLLLAKTGLRLSNKTSRYFSEIEIPKNRLFCCVGLRDPERLQLLRKYANN